ncbi:serine/threonine-protein kinase PRP4 homolog [Xyrichtys novacula]|uniref:Mitogen-activated protein kinase kinase kinase 19 n=2 Tax=Xyrichtys novacula TaxID=13765 RepID=A0AAV1GZ49_XYRNO|nr:serine/threonine-protein kinase PRP4 homolog [Xyrichtys novacula]
METLSDIRQAYQDAGRGSRGGVSLPSLGLNSRRWTLDPDHSSGLQSTRTSCLPVPPRHRQRTRSVAAASSSSPGRTFVAEPSELSQSAPSIMEPLLSSNTMMQARAHIQSRLGAQDTATEQKFPQRPLPTPHPRTPRLLAPLDSRLRDIIPLPGLKHPIPLKPISRSPLCSRARLKRGGLSRGSSRLGPLTTKGGSEDSGSSSSQSSMDLEDEDEGVSGGVHLKFVGDLLLQTSNNVSSSVTDSVSNTTGCSKVPPRTRHFSQIHRSAHDLNEEPFNHSDDPFRTVTYTTYHCEDKVNQISDTKDHVDSNTFTKQQGNTLNLTQVTISNEMPITSKPQEERTSAGYTPDPQTEVSNRTSVNKDQSGVEKSSRNDQTKWTEKTFKDCFYEKTLRDDPDQKLDLMTADNRNVDTSGDTKLSKVLKSVQNKERKATKNCEAEAEIQTNPESFSRPPNKDRISSNRIKIKENLKTLSTQVEVKTRKSHELKINGESVTKVKSKLKCVKGTATSSPRKKVTDPAHSRRATPDRSNINKDQQHLPKTEPKSARQLKRPSLEGSSRSRSVLDFITYKDMFQQIQSGDKGPAIYEMFAGPIYENLRVSSSCEKVKDRQVRSAPPRKTHKVKQRPMKQPQSKQRRSLADSTEDSPKSKAKLSTPRAKPQVTSAPRRGTEKIKQILDGHSDTELHALTEAGSCPNSSEETAGDQMLPTIEEDLSRYESEILKSDNKTLTGPATLSHSGYSYPQEKDGNSSTGCQNLLMSESSQSPQHPKINTWTSSSSNNHTIMSPVYQRFLDGVGDGPLTDDLLQCLAEELISLDERDVSTGPDPSEKEYDGESNLLMVNKTENVDLLGSGLIVDDNISWTKGEVLGRGAYGTVYCGLTSRGELIAVKQVSLDASDPDAAKREYNRLQGEVDLLKTLRHNNIVGFLGTSLHQHVVSIFMEYIPGGSIASILHRFGPLPERVLALYTHQILEGVTFLHLNRVIHRDLKGNNVMLMPTGVIKLIDFGCARRLSCLNHTASNSGDLLKSVHGTPYWMAPEVINETGYGRKSDVWSVGCTVFEMATGKPPLAHMDKMAALFYIGAQRGKMPSLPDGFSQSAKDFVKICLTSNQRQRPSAEKLLTHPFIPQNETGANSWETQRRNRCGHLEGLCG